MMFRFLAAPLAGLLITGAAWAGEAQDIAGRAESEAASGKHVEAIASMREAMLAVWDKAPLTFVQSFPVSKRATGFGVYEKRPDGPYKNDEPLLIYVEPVGYGWKKDGDIYNSEIAADFAVRDAAGKVLGGQKDFGNFKLSSHARNSEYYVNLRYNFTGLAAGSYVIVTTFRDIVSGKSASFETNFEVQ